MSSCCFISLKDDIYIFMCKVDSICHSQSHVGNEYVLYQQRLIMFLCTARFSSLNGTVPFYRTGVLVHTAAAWGHSLSGGSEQMISCWMSAETRRERNVSKVTEESAAHMFLWHCSLPSWDRLLINEQWDYHTTSTGLNKDVLCQMLLKIK